MPESILKRLKGKENVLLDTMLFIYLFEGDEKYADVVEKIIALANEKVFSAIISPISAAEILVKPVRLGEVAIADKYRNVLCNIPNIKNVPLNFEIAFLAGSLRGKYELPLPDMFQAATAIYHSKLPAIITNDKALKKLAGELDVYILDEFI